LQNPKPGLTTRGKSGFQVSNFPQFSLSLHQKSEGWQTGGQSNRRLGGNPKA
jgi:hypothetical protein